MHFINLIRKFLLYKNPIIPALINNCAHYWWYNSDDTFAKNTYLGVRILQNPLDLHIYQELIYSLNPDFILQTGVFDGGSLLYYANLLDAMGASSSKVVIGIDIQLSESAKKIGHPRIKLIEGSSVEASTLEKIRELLPVQGGMVILDSDHSRDHVYREMELYYQFVGIGSYMVVEDTNVNGHPVLRSHGPGPMEAVKKFLKTYSGIFVQDNEIWKRNGYSHHQYGWLRRVK